MRGFSVKTFEANRYPVDQIRAICIIFSIRRTKRQKSVQAKRETSAVITYNGLESGSNYPVVEKPSMIISLFK